MEPTTFRTYSLNLGGAPNAAIRVVRKAAHYQRVVLFQDTGTTGALVSTSAAELDLAGPVFAGEAFTLSPQTVQVLVVGPGQHLVAVGTSIVVPTRLSVSISAEIPPPPKIFPEIKDPAFFRTFTPSIIGTDAIRIVPASNLPQRVVIDNPIAGTQIFIASMAAELGIVQAIPGDAFTITAPAPNGIAATFILAPEQALHAAQTAAGSLLGVHASKLDLPALRGPTGIPGPDGEE
jgi:hypothetical protein